MLGPDDFATALPNANTEDLERIITNVEAMAAHFAPIINTPAFQEDADKVATVKAIISKAVIYEVRSRDGMTASEQGGPFSYTLDKSVPQSSLYFSPQQIEVLKSLGKITVSQGPYSLPLATRPNRGW